MPKTIHISNLDRRKLGAQLHYGAQVTIQKRLKERGITASDRTIRHAFEPKYPLTPKIGEIIKETVAYLEELNENYQVRIFKDLEDALTGS